MLLFTYYILHINNSYVFVHTDYVLKLPWLQRWTKQTSSEIELWAGLQARAHSKHTQLTAIRLHHAAESPPCIEPCRSRLNSSNKQVCLKILAIRMIYSTGKFACGYFSYVSTALYNHTPFKIYVFIYKTNHGQCHKIEHTRPKILKYSPRGSSYCYRLRYNISQNCQLEQQSIKQSKLPSVQLRC